MLIFSFNSPSFIILDVGTSISPEVPKSEAKTLTEHARINNNHNRYNIKIPTIDFSEKKRRLYSRL